MAVRDLATVQLKEFDAFNDVIMRVFTERGSSPIVIVQNGEVNSAEDVGQQVLDLFRYMVESPVFDKAQEVSDAPTG